MDVKTSRTAISQLGRNEKAIPRWIERADARSYQDPYPWSSSHKEEKYHKCATTLRNEGTGPDIRLPRLKDVHQEDELLLYLTSNINMGLCPGEQRSCGKQETLLFQDLAQNISSPRTKVALLKSTWVICKGDSLSSHLRSCDGGAEVCWSHL